LIAMPTIIFFGPDGSGKSTLIKALARGLHHRKCNVKISWMRGSHTLASLTAKILSKFDSFKGSDNPYYNITVPKNLTRLWQFLEFLSALPIILGEFLIPSLMEYWVLADRYTLDLMVWISLATNDKDFFKRLEARVLIALAKRTCAKFYVTANIEELKKRTTKLWFPEEQLHLYNKLAVAIGAYTIDTTNKSVDASFQEVLNVLNRANLKIKLRND